MNKKKINILLILIITVPLEPLNENGNISIPHKDQVKVLDVNKWIFDLE